MAYKILADTMVVLHFSWILFLFFGAYWGLKNKGVKRVHIGGLLFALILHVFDWYCPLTHLEIWLRSRHNPGLGYSGSFIIHYLEQMIYLDLSPTLILLLTVLLCLVNAYLYLKMFRCKDRPHFST